MTPRRRLAAALTAGAAGILLTGCERPAPIVTVVSGTHSDWKEADVFCFEEQSFEDGDCAQRADGPVEIPVTPGERVGVDVGKGVVERGWFIELAGTGEPQRSEVFEDKHYFAFTAPGIGPEGATLTVRTLGAAGEQGPPSGEWVFRLVPEQ